MGGEFILNLLRDVSKGENNLTRATTTITNTVVKQNVELPKDYATI